MEEEQTSPFFMDSWQEVTNPLGVPNARRADDTNANTFISFSAGCFDRARHVDNGRPLSVGGGGGGGPDFAGMTEALGDPNIHMIGLCGTDDDAHVGYALKNIERRVKLVGSFGVIVMVSIRERPDLITIQQEIAQKLGFTYQQQHERTPACCVFSSRNGNEKAVAENAKQLSDRIRAQPTTILFILRDLHGGLDLAKLGIPFGVNHQGCKLLLTSHSKEILSNHMNVQHTYRV